MTNQFICSLDYQEAYDRMAPEITFRFLSNLGWPLGFLRVLLSVWGDQQRFIQYEGHTHSHIFHATQSAPQGCPCAPAILALWMSSGARFLEGLMGQIPGRLIIYVDDRTFTARSWSHLEQQIHGWHQFSNTIGLLESQTKTQVAAKGVRNCRILQANADPQWVRTEIKFLGVTSTSKPRQHSESENERTNSALIRASLLGCTGMHWNRMVLAFRMFVVSKFGYGWVSRDPTQRISKKIFTRLSQALKTARTASPWVRKVLYGANVDFACLHVTQQWKRMRKIINSVGRPSWVVKPHTGLHLLRANLKKWGWLESAPWFWRKASFWNQSTPAENRTLDLRTNSHQVVESQLHSIRLAYKQTCFFKLLNQDRRETRSWSHLSTSQLVQFFSKIDLQSTWCTMQTTCGAGRAVLLGSFRSPLCNHNSDPGIDPHCPHCACPLGNLDHLFWRCPAMTPPTLRLPQNPLQRRFGWFPHDPGPQSDFSPLDVFEHMRKVVILTWEKLHG